MLLVRSIFGSTVPAALGAAALLVTLLLSVRPARAATVVPGGNVVNQTWTPSGNPFVLQGDVTVPQGATLTIQAGVVVQVASSDSQGAGRDRNKSELTVAGSLVVAGTATDPVVFQAQSATSAGAWYGIVFAPTATASSIEHATVQHAAYGVSTEAPSLAVSNVTFTANTYGIHVAAGSPAFVDVTSTANTSYGVYVTGAGAPSFTRAAIVRNASYGVYVNGSGAVSLVASTIHGQSSYGVYGGGSGSTITVKNSIVSKNGSYGLYRSSSGSTFDVTYTDVWGSSTNANVTLGTGCFTANPLFVSDTNVRLTSNSPARLSGDNQQDLGARPFAGDPTPGLYGTLWSSQRLALSGSPYTVEGDLTVGPGTTLTLEPGVELKFTTSDIMGGGVDAQRAELRVGGALQAVGTAAAKIRFAAASGSSANSWSGVTFLSTAAGSALEQASIEHAAVGILYQATGVNAFRRVTLQGNTVGARVSAGRAEFDALVATKNTSYGVHVTESGAVDLRNARVVSNSSYGLYVATSGTGLSTSIVNATVHANSYGLYLNPSAAHTIRIKNSLVTQNGSYGIYKTGSGATVELTHSDVWGSSTNLQSVTAGAGCISQNPNYVSAPTDLRLTQGSVAIDAADAVGAPNEDAEGGSRPLDGDGIQGAAFDMGAHEFAFAPRCGDGFVNPGETCDDGNNNGAYGYCKPDCTGLGARCGDGVVEGSEECDDGNRQNGDACLATCKRAACGDGYVQMGVEQCDDGNRVDTDVCNNQCKLAHCGDGRVDPFEVCDDGNTSNTDACLNVCTAAFCGDGYLRAGAEQCDDGNNISGDGCNAICRREAPRPEDASAGEDASGLPEADSGLPAEPKTGSTSDGTKPGDNSGASTGDDAGEGCQLSQRGQGSLLPFALLLMTGLPLWFRRRRRS